jgi:mono/diheme cytochrome c family protein
MSRKSVSIWLAIAVLVFAARPALAQSNGAAEASKTIWDGVYTAAQAARGEAVVAQNCGTCHSSNEWASAMFISSWSGRPISALQSQLRTTMPFDSPGRLSAAQYTDIVAYMLKLNNAPVGDVELPTSDDALNSITVTRPLAGN